MTNSIKEIEDTDCIFLIGSNPTEAHPVLGTFMKRARLKGAKVIVVDPRRIEMAEYADIHITIKPGTNIAFINAVCHVIYEEKLYDEEYIKNRTEDFEELIETIAPYTPEYAAEVCEINAEDIRRAARMYATAEKAGIYYCLGITEHTTGTRNVMSLSNLAMMTGNIGKESAGVNPIRGQNNVQGACDMGALPADYPGYQKVFKPEVKEKFEKAWGVELSGEIGMTATEMLPAAIEGDLKGLYIFGEDQALSDPDLAHVRKAFNSLDFLIVQDMFMTSTAEFADVVLPATSYAEKDGTFTNTERRVQRVRKAIPPLSGSRVDWDIITDISRRMGYHMQYNSSEEIFDEMASLTPSYAGISYPKIDGLGVQWPCPTADHPGTRFMHKDIMARGVGLFMPFENVEPAEVVDEEYPYILSTGRNLYQYNVITMTGRTEGIMQKEGSSYVEISEELAGSLGIEHGELIELASRRGRIKTTARVTDAIRDNIMYMPFHYVDGAANELTNAALCPNAKTPEYKVAAVKIEKIGG